MPNRIIKESICYSDDLDKLSSFEETVFYRLLVRVDDYGRIDARPSFLKSTLFVTKKGITDKNIEEAVAKLASVGLVQVYEVTGKPFLLFPKWSLHQRIRKSREKYPAPQQNNDFDNSPQFAASGGELPPESESESESETYMPSENSENGNSDILDGDDIFESIYKIYPKKLGKAKAKEYFISYLTNGHEIKGFDKIKYNHLQIYFSVKEYAAKVKDTDPQYIKQFDGFLNKTILDYADIIKEPYEDYMLDEYGEEWQKIKFKYKFKGEK